MLNRSIAKRRTFLHTLAIASTAAICKSAPLKAFAAKGRVGANDLINIGYIGAGRRALQLMDLPPEARIVAVADVHLSRAEVVAKKYQGVACQDYRKLLDMKDVDAVVIATPDHWHALPSIHACQIALEFLLPRFLILHY